MRTFASVSVLGGAGLVGYQVCRRLLKLGVTNRLLVVSLGRDEVTDAVARLRREHPQAGVLGLSGNVFGHGALEDVDLPPSPPAPPATPRERLQDIYESFEGAKRKSALVRFLAERRPQAVVDCINTATAISYQDVPTAAKRLMSDLGWRAGSAADAARAAEDAEALLQSIEIPQLVLHVRLLIEGLRAAGSEVYLKVGTTGTGGMGLNIPYTHGEDKPSPTLMAKTAVAFAHSGLLFLAARTEGAPVVKELKPAAMIGYREVAVCEVPGSVWERKGDRFVKRKAASRPLYRARTASLKAPLDLAPDASAFEVRRDESGRARTMRLACVNTGENGWFARGEFEAITALDQMEMITPEEIARAAVQEIQGRSTGRDVIAALDASILAPTYKGGLTRQVAIDRIALLDEEGAVPSVALGDLGPPQLSKYLFELELLKSLHPTLEEAAMGARAPGAADALAALLERRPDLRDAIVSVGIPILLPDGGTVLRGPEVKIPGYDPTEPKRTLAEAEIDAFARKGWVDLRPRSLERWGERLDRVVASRRGGSAGASDAMSHESYGRDDFRIGEVVAWIFANEPEFEGYRIK